MQLMRDIGNAEVVQVFSRKALPLHIKKLRKLIQSVKKLMPEEEQPPIIESLNNSISWIKESMELSDLLTKIYAEFDIMIDKKSRFLLAAKLADFAECHDVRLCNDAAKKATIYVPLSAERREDIMQHALLREGKAKLDYFNKLVYPRDDSLVLIDKLSLFVPLSIVQWAKLGYTLLPIARDRGLINRQL